MQSRWFYFGRNSFHLYRLRIIYSLGIIDCLLVGVCITVKHEYHPDVAELAKLFKMLLLNYASIEANSALGSRHQLRLTRSASTIQKR